MPIFQWLDYSKMTRSTVTIWKPEAQNQIHWKSRFCCAQYSNVWPYLGLIIRTTYGSKYTFQPFKFQTIGIQTTNSWLVRYSDYYCAVGIRIAYSNARYSDRDCILFFCKLAQVSYLSTVIPEQQKISFLLPTFFARINFFSNTKIISRYGRLVFKKKLTLRIKRSLLKL